MLRFLFSFSIVVSLFTGCNSSQPVPHVRSAQPAWILNPNQDGKIGAIGVAARTYDQKISTQRKLAITRALDELSLQQQVKVHLSMTKRDKVSNNSSSMNMDTQSNYKSNATITAHIADVYKDKTTGELYVWMVMD